MKKLILLLACAGLIAGCARNHEGGSGTGYDNDPGSRTGTGTNWTDSTTNHNRTGTDSQSDTTPHPAPGGAP
jgi:hypothetical protein